MRTDTADAPLNIVPKMAAYNLTARLEAIFERQRVQSARLPINALCTAHLLTQNFEVNLTRMTSQTRTSDTKPR
jgi:hypothetical protein